jgi:hypothetical protein
LAEEFVRFGGMTYPAVVGSPEQAREWWWMPPRLMGEEKGALHELE